MPSKFNKLIQRIRDLTCISLAAFTKLSPQKENAILMYHSVDNNEAFLTVTAEDFIQQMEYLKRSFEIVSLEEMVSQRIEARKSSRKLAAITFDDGYEDFYWNAYPYLHNGNLPATVFIAPAYVGKKWPFDGSNLKLLDWGQVKEISRNKIEIGAHSVTHIDLRSADLPTAKREIAESKKQLEEQIKKSVVQFSFPFGRCSNDTVNLAKSLGFKVIVGDPRNIPNKSLVLRRIQIDKSCSFILFKARLTKAKEWTETLEGILKIFFLKMIR